MIIEAFPKKVSIISKKAAVSLERIKVQIEIKHVIFKPFVKPITHQ